MDRTGFQRSLQEQDKRDDSDDEADIYKYRSRLKEAASGSSAPTTPSLDTSGKAEYTGAGTTGSGGDAVEDQQPETPFYSYATEKYDTHADAKLIYQRHRLDNVSNDGGTPFMLGRSPTLPASFFEASGINRKRTTSINLRPSNLAPDDKVTGNLGLPPSLAREGKSPATNLFLNPISAADEKARSHANHPGLPHEIKDTLLADQGVHGAGAGMGIGTGAGGFATAEGTIVSEVEAICNKIKTLLDLRRKYMKVSLQCDGDNPKDEDTWEIYPPPPEPVWTDVKERPDPPDNVRGSRSNSLSQTDVSASQELASTASATTSGTVRRKAGQSIGEDFDFSQCQIPAASLMNFKLDQSSVYQVYDSEDAEGTPIVSVPTLRDYYMDLEKIHEISSNGPAKSFAYRRLQYLEGRYNLYTLLNEYEEVAETKKVPHRDFYNIRKVDTHVHHSACMNQKHLLRFIKSKMKKCPDDHVLFRDGKRMTLKEVFESIQLTAYDLSIDTLDMHAHTDSFHRFDKFNLKYNPIGQSRLRDIFLKTDNFIKGRYLAQITREVISDLESSKYQMVEWRISIYGRSIDEWDKLAAWVLDNRVLSPNVRWLIQVPRLYEVYKSTKMMESFEAVIVNVFRPLFEVTKDPKSHPKLHIFLQRVIGFDSVDDESKVERRLYRKYPTPKEWDSNQNPPYGYWIYFLFANMTSLNAFRKRRGFNTFLLRPHCGEAGDTDHLAAALLCCHSISHGITLRKVPIFQYVFYLDQIGIAMSPLSNNALFLTYDRNPFVSYFRKGLNVSLSTDDPLQFAFTKEPLIEEYSVAAQIYKFSAVDMCELAKHSVDQSGFELSLKQRWLGRRCYLPGLLGNDVSKSNVPDVREAFRHETLKAEHAFLAKYTQDDSHFQRFNPVPEPTPSTPIEDILDQPKRYFEHIAEATEQASRLSTTTTGEPRAGTGAGAGGKSTNDLESLNHVSKPLSRSWTAPHTHGAQDIFPALVESSLLPGIFLENERRRRGRGVSGAAAAGFVDGGGGAGGGEGLVVSGLARDAVPEEEGSTADDDSD